MNGQSRPSTINKCSYLSSISRIDTSNTVPMLGIFPYATRPEPAERQEFIVNVSAYVEPWQGVVVHLDVRPSVDIQGSELSCSTHQE